MFEMLPPGARILSPSANLKNNIITFKVFEKYTNTNAFAFNNNRRGIDT